MKKSTRIACSLLLGLIIILSALAAALPVWLPWVAKPVAGMFGAEWSELNRQGWSSYSLKEVSFVQNGVNVEIDQLAIPQPFPWLAQGMGIGALTNVEAGTLTLTLGPGGDPEDSTTLPMDLIADLHGTLLDLLPWIPEVSMDAFQLTTAEGEQVIVIEEIHLKDRMLKARWPGIGEIPMLSVQVWLTDDSIRLSTFPTDKDQDLLFHAALHPQKDLPDLTASLVSQGTPLNFDATFATKEWLPDSLEIQSNAWPVPEGVVHWRGIQAPDLLADISFRMLDNSFDSEIDITGEAVLPDGSVEPATIKTKLKGNSEEVDVEAVTIELAWLSAHLTEPVGFSIAERKFSGTSEFNLQADLAKQDWIDAKGMVNAKASIDTNRTTRPDCLFSINGEDIEVFGQVISALLLEGNLDTDQLVFEEIDIRLDEASSLNANASISLKNKSIDGQGEYFLTSEWLKPLTGDLQVFSNLEGILQIEGPFNRLLHEGSIRPVTIQGGNSLPISVSVDWSGISTEQISVDAGLSTEAGGQAEVVVQLTRENEGQSLRADIDQAIFTDPLHGPLNLNAPFTIQMQLAPAFSLESISRFRVSREEHFLDLEYLKSEQLLKASGDNLHTSSLGYWIDQSIPDFMLDDMDLSITQSQPFIAGEFALKTHSADERLEMLELNVNGQLTDTGVSINHIDALFGEAPFITGNVFLPFIIHLEADSAGRLFSSVPQQNLGGTLEVDIPSSLVDQFPELPVIGVLPSTRISITAEGTPDAPVASIQASLSDLDILKLLDERLDEHAFKNITLSATLTEDVVSVQNLETRMQNGLFKMDGTMPTEALFEFATGDNSSAGILLENLATNVLIENVATADYAPILPNFLRRSGRIDGTLEIKPGLDITGNVEARNFSLRPTLYFQTVDDINLSLDIKGSKFEITRASAAVGNSIVGLEGFLDFSDLDNPIYSLDVKGERTPMVRTPDFLLYGDIDLQLRKTDPETPAELSGDLGLRDGVLLLDIDPLAARTAGQEIPKPPFFNIDREPFSNWVLDVYVHGDEFLHLKSPYGKAVMSTQMNLTGNLSHPIWVGSVNTSEGTIDFPGIRMAVSRSEIYVTRENQSALQLDLNAIGQASSYVVTLQVSGDLDDPHVEFLSTPDLTNAKILQLLTTGTTDSSSLSTIGFYLGKGLFGTGSGNSLWDRVSVEIGRDVTESTKDTIDLYYDFSNRLRLHGQYDKYDAQNLNLEWKVFSK